MMTTLSKLSKSRLPVKAIVSSTLNHGTFTKMMRTRKYQTLAGQYRHRVALTKRPLDQLAFQNPVNYQTRNVGMLVGRILRGVLKIRYLLIGGAVSGGISLQKVSLYSMNLVCS